VLKKLGLHSLGRPARAHLLLTKTLLLVGQERGTHREGDKTLRTPCRITNLLGGSVEMLMAVFQTAADLGTLVIAFVTLQSVYSYSDCATRISTVLSNV
jgi:hypothetical protein